MNAFNFYKNLLLGRKFLRLLAFLFFNRKMALMQAIIQVTAIENRVILRLPDRVRMRTPMWPCNGGMRHFLSNA
ncbi:hypothetical protein [Polaromonas sp. DSR2-3-2]|uniref:hypothetical protein n=1 Tax=unclassified Polaromonas TaxID=2638319 RepID=UPI003CFBC209